MLSISNALIGSGHATYYTNLAREDYYLKGGEPPGEWMGTGAGQLNVTGEVREKDFLSLFAGFDPKSGQALTQNSGKDKRRGAWDLTFSAPKSVSALRAVSDKETRALIETAQREAVRASLAYLEAGLICRRGKDGVEMEGASVAIATFPHTTSRAQDPQLHTHAVLLNVGVRDDGSTGTLEVKSAFYQKLAAGALYRAELAKRMHDLGYGIEAAEEGFGITGVPQNLMDHWSKRRKEIEAEQKRIGKENAKDAARITLRTRKRKEYVAREELDKQLQEEGRQFGFGLEEARQLRKDRSEEVTKDPTAQETTKAIGAALSGKSSFYTRDLIREIALLGPTHYMGAEEILELSRATLKSSDEILKFTGDIEKYTTKRLVALELEALAAAEEIASVKRAEINEATVSEVITKKSLTPEQVTALKFVTLENRGIAVVQGLPGVGKSYTLGAIREVLEANGLEVVGAVLQGKAARGLETESGIKSKTIAGTIIDLEKGKQKLTEKSVLVIDEAAMVGTEQMHKLLTAVAAAKARIVLVGDEQQLQSIDTGGMFTALKNTFGSTAIKTVFRQKEDWAREAVKDLHSGEADKALAAFAEHGRLHVSETRDEASAALIAAWAEKDIGTPEKTLILGTTRAEVAALNSAAQAARREHGHLSEEGLDHGKETLHIGDRILITKNSKIRGLQNGDFGVITGIKKSPVEITVAFDNGETKSIRLKEFEDVQLGYATTVHKAQGATVDRAYVLGGGPLVDKHMGLVQASRSRFETMIFLEQDEEGDIAEYIKSMGEERLKILATNEELESSDVRTTTVKAEVKATIEERRRAQHESGPEPKREELTTEQSDPEAQREQLSSLEAEAKESFRKFHSVVLADRYRIRCEKAEEGKRKVEEFHHTVNRPTGLPASEVYKSLSALKAREQEGWQVYIEPIDRHDDFLVLRGVTAAKQALFEEKKFRPCVTLKSETDERTIVVRIRRSGNEEREEAMEDLYRLFNKRVGRADIANSRWITFPGFTDGGKATEVIPGSQYGCEMVDAVRKDFAAKISKYARERRQRIKAAVPKLDGVGRQVAAHCLDVLKRRRGRRINATQFDLMITLRLRALGRTKEEARRGLLSVLSAVRPSAEQSIIEERVTAAIEVGYSDKSREKVRRLMAHRERYQKMELELVRGLNRGLQR